MKKIIFLLWIFLVPFISWCVSQEEYDDLKTKNNDLEDQLNYCQSNLEEAQTNIEYANANIEEANSTIDDLNWQIDDVQSYVGWSYYDLNYAVDGMTYWDTVDTVE